MAYCGRFITSEDYIDIIYRKTDEIAPSSAGGSDYCITDIDDRWGIIYVNRQESKEVSFDNFGYISFPILYTPQDYQAMNSAGITRTREQTFLNLSGKGVLIGLIDTGIMASHEAFIRPDGTNAIEAIWDQTGKEVIPSELVSFGKLYARENIYDNLQVDNNLNMVTDIADGHGTFMAGLLVGQEKLGRNFTGAAPDADLVVVKLKTAKQYLKDFYLVNDEALCYSETDIIWGVRFLNDYARRQNKPIVIVIGLGSNMSSHMASSALSEYIGNINRQVGRCVVTCTGNYASERLHFSGRILDDMPNVPVEINVGQNEKGFFAGLWSNPPQLFSLEFASPLGKVSSRVVPRVNKTTDIIFGLEGTRIEVYYGIIQAVSGYNFIGIKFINPAPGIWTIYAYGDNAFTESFDLWLPNREFLWSDTYILASDPYNTITDPGNTPGIITVGAYNYRDNSIFLRSGRGENVPYPGSPDVVAPGVRVLGPLLINNEYGEKTGTSYAAAIAGGGAALIMEYGIVKGNYPYMRGDAIRNYIVTGANRTEQVRYPNPLSGYGFIDIYQAIANVRR